MLTSKNDQIKDLRGRLRKWVQLLLVVKMCQIMVKFLFSWAILLELQTYEVSQNWIPNVFRISCMKRTFIHKQPKINAKDFVHKQKNIK